MAPVEVEVGHGHEEHRDERDPDHGGPGVTDAGGEEKGGHGGGQPVGGRHRGGGHHRRVEQVEGVGPEGGRRLPVGHGGPEGTGHLGRGGRCVQFSGRHRFVGGSPQDTVPDGRRAAQPPM